MVQLTPFEVSSERDTGYGAATTLARSRAYELVAHGQIPAVRIGRSVRVPRRELDQWLADQRYLDVAPK